MTQLRTKAALLFAVMGALWLAMEGLAWGAYPTALMNNEPLFTAGSSNYVSWSCAYSHLQVQADDDPSFGTPSSHYVTNCSHYIFSGLSNGVTYYYRVRAYDDADNCGAWSGVVSSTQDSTLPTCELTSPGIWLPRAPFTVPWTTSDTVSGVKDTYVYANGSLCSHQHVGAPGSMTATGSATVNPSGSGTYSIYARATDWAGNERTSSTLSVYVDGDKPVSAVSSLPPTYPMSTVSLSVTRSDVGSGADHVDLYYRRQPPGSSLWGSWNQYGGSYVCPPSGYMYVTFSFATTGGNGTYEFYTVATDRVGNVESAPATADAWTVVSVTNDSTPPSSHVNSVSSPRSTLDPFDVDWTYSDNASGVQRVDLWVAVNSKAQENWSCVGSGSPDGPLSYTPPGEGVYYFLTVAQDYSGSWESANYNSPDVTIVVDTAPPSSCVNPIASPRATWDAFDVTWTATDGGGGIDHVDLYCSVGGAPYTVVGSGG
ncbi:MAG: hypothetical protein KKI08_12865, partial [Armatimonadetes bacterium]|nr:hypothetical protein [Armatimonadota bacterium]